MQPSVLRTRRKRSSSAGSWVAIEPPTVELWPSMYLVVESSVRSAPNSNGRCKTGVRKVLSTASLTPAAWAILAMAAMSVSLSVGFAGVSMNTSFVLGWIACATDSGSDVSTNEASTLKFASTCWNRRTVPP